MGPERPAEETEERQRLEPLALSEPRRRAIGDRLEAAARGRQSRRRLLAAGAAGAAVALAVLLVTARPRPVPDAGTTARLRTGAGDFRLLSLGDRGVAFVSEGTDLELHLDRTPALRVHRGSVHLVVRHRAGEKFVVATSAADVTVLGTEFDVTVADGTTEVSVARGEVEVRNAQGRRRLWPKESARARPGEAPRMVLPLSSIIVDGPAVIERVR